MTDEFSSLEKEMKEEKNMEEADKVTKKTNEEGRNEAKSKNKCH